MFDTKTLREEFASLHQQTDTLLTAAAEAKRELTAEETTANTQRFARMETIKKQLDDAKKLAEFALTNGDAQTPTSPEGREEFDAERDGVVKFDLEGYKAAVNHFARTGDLSKCQKFAITSTSGSGAFIPKEVTQPTTVRRLPNAIRALLAFFGIAPVSRNLTEAITIPVVDDTANTGATQNEGATSGTTADADASASMTLNPSLYTSKQQWLSNTTVNATDFDAFGWVIPTLQRRFDKIQESAWIADLKSNATTGETIGASGIRYPNVIAWEHSLPAAYRTDAGFILSDSAYQQIRGLTDTNGRPIMDLDPTNQFQAMIHGKPVLVSDYLDTVLPSGAKVVGIFASADAIKVFDAGPKRLARYVLDPNHPDQTGFELFGNGDADFVSAGVRLLKTP